MAGSTARAPAADRRLRHRLRPPSVGAGRLDDAAAVRRQRALRGSGEARSAVAGQQGRRAPSSATAGGDSPEDLDTTGNVRITAVRTGNATGHTRDRLSRQDGGGERGCTDEAGD
ncbi:MAG: hypothetical protein JNM48_14980 [Rhodospirillales bacterium]|nr:hypothetical protein [Rhodospirillales bacterium]